MPHIIPGRGIPAGGVAHRSHMPNMLALRALPSGRRAPGLRQVHHASRDYAETVTGIRPVSTLMQRDAALASTTTTATIIMTVSAVLRSPEKCREGSGPIAIGQKFVRTLNTPAVNVVTDTNESGSTVTQAYRALPLLMIIVVPTA